MVKFDKLTVPTEGEKIEIEEDKLKVSDNPIIPVIEGDGIGPDIMRATRRVLDAAVEKTYAGKKKIVWFDIYAGDAGMKKYGEVLPKDTFKAIEHFIVALKGPLTTPVGGGYRSLNVTLRQVLTLYACVRPVRYFEGVPSPVRHPEKMNVVIFRENTEDVYAGIEWAEGTEEVKKLINWLNTTYNLKIRTDSGVGIKPISITGTERLVRKAIKYALEFDRKSVTLVHKGNIMKYTEGAFRDWGYKLATREFRDQVVTEEELWSQYNGQMPAGKTLIKDRIADSMFQQILTRTDEYDVVATPNLNGDYLSDACAAQVGGLGMAPGANIGDFVGLFEATHGTAPKYANKDMVNPGSLILSGCMMLEYLGWREAAELIYKALGASIRQKRVTYDLHRLMEGATKLKTSEFGTAIIENMG
ncbi:isocitrate dehydrogenase [candidate division WOR-1 bacterium DG_54_3]|uniref:Isocitrate dehydrogenase [NADP] n=1 Tax=candidate division WOR-1 bacterium DG_54_3 TaxID=1703775 RepID=A0A0S7XR68_UNCSA|nr:MAG: isocitrate dehydrogenase [candidate division WOR-1 bacterium DG_54_3]